MNLSITRSLGRALLYLAAATLSTFGFAATINVPADQKTIQAGIDAANPGDTVLVAPGVYYENIDFKGKAITVTSSDGAASTIIDGGGHDATVGFYNSETRASVISALTIRNGGPGIAVGSSPTIRGNTIISSYCSGIDVEFGTPLIENNDIKTVFPPMQTVSKYCSNVGVGISLGGTASNTGFAGTSIIGNTIELSSGGGILINASRAAFIQNNTIRNNPGGYGGIAAFYVDTISIVQNLIYGNVAGSGFFLASGGINVNSVGSTVGPFLGIIGDNTIAGNTVKGATLDGTVVPTGEQVDLSGNLAEYLLVNNVIVGSSSTVPTVNCVTDGALTLTPPVFDHNDIYNPSGPTYGGACTSQTGSSGNLSVDPLFSNPSARDYTLRSNSAVIDSGNNSAPLMPSLDFAGDPRIQNATGKSCTIDLGAYEYPGTQDQCSTVTEKLQSSLNPSSPGQTVTFSAQLTGPNGVSAGTIQFSDGATVLSTQAISGAGFSTFSTSLLAIGSHNITATYQPSSNLAATSATLTQVVNGYTTATTLTSSINPSSVTQAVIFTATVSSASETPTGLITFTDGAATLGTQTLVNGVATFTTASLTNGTHLITAAYSPTGTSFNASSATLSQVVQGIVTTTTIASSLNPADASQLVTFTANVTFLLNGVPVSAPGHIIFYDAATDLSGAVPLNQGIARFTTSLLTIGSHQIMAKYFPPDVSFDQTEAVLTQVIKGIGTTISLTVLPPTAAFGTTISMFSQVFASAKSVTSGTITYMDGAAPLITITLAPNLIPNFNISTLAVGSHSITAVYSGDANYLPSTSAPVSLDIFLSDFTLIADPTITIRSGHHKDIALILASLGNFSDSITLACGLMPAYASCTFPSNPRRLADGGTLSSSLEINTDAIFNYLSRNDPSMRTPASPFLRNGIGFALLVPGSLLVALRRSRAPHRTIKLLVINSVLVIAMSLTGCSGHYPGHTPSGRYPITITGTGATSHISHTATFTLIVAE